MSSYKAIKIEREADGIVFVVLNRPEKRNAMSPQLNHEMCDVVARMETDPDVRVLVLPVTHSPPEGPHNRFTPEPPSPPASP